MKTMLTDSLTITIKSDGYKVVSASCKDITVEAKCNDTDTFNLSKGSHMALKRLIDKMKESAKEDNSNKIEKGDIVEILEVGNAFLSATIGIQGIVTESDGNLCARVKLPIMCTGDKQWLYNINNLKLIRKASK